MAVEYRHFIVVNDPDWLPQSDTLLRVDEVLRKWSLVAGKPSVFDLSDMTKKTDREVPVNEPSAGAALIYHGAAGEEVEQIAGASLFPGVDQDNRSIQSTSVVVGMDYRIQPSSEMVCFELVEPNPGSLQQMDVPRPLYKLFVEYIPSTETPHPPVMKIHITPSLAWQVAWEDFPGYWRGGVVLDFGKDIPHFADNINLLPNRQFVADLSRAFRAKLAEVGHVY